jgi:hypothetical protein
MFRRLEALISFAAFSAVCAAAAAPVGWRTYHSPEYGFTVSYPPSFRFYASGRRDGPGGYIPICLDTTVACFGYTGTEYEGTNFEAAGIAVNVLRDARTEQECDKPDSVRRPIPAKSETVHGIRFHYGDSGEGGLSHFAGGPAYRIFYQNVCFEIAARIADVSLGAFDPGTIKSLDPAKLNRLLEQMVHTFQFVGPVKDGPDWKVSYDSGCGGVFEYPAEDTVRVVAEYSNGRENSDQVTCARAFTHQERDYTVAVKERAGYHAQIDAWLKSSGYPGIEHVRAVDNSQLFTDYDAGPYHYLYRQGEIFIFSVSDTAHHVISPGGDRVYRHWLASFKVY